ncbi:MAG: caspase family protein [Polaromonas sp.]|nr:caspase family protein [Polaromonas sp.]MDO9258529.1 caspase family protein [Polaromonas sp.]
MRDLRFLFKTHYGVSRALVIGIDKYKSASPLSYAVSDAVSIRDLLVSDFDFPESEVTLLTDEAATRQAVLKAFLRFANNDVGLDDRLVVFFAGHGHTRTGSRGEIGYLVPHDADMCDFSTFIRWDELTRNADLIRAKHVFFIMDACYGGLALVRATGAGSTRFLKDMMLRTSRQVLTAGKADEVVSDSGGPIPNHSVFTGHLIEALQGKAATSDGVLTASAVMSYVYAKVASDNNSHQTPHYGHVDGDGDMVLLAPGLSELEESDTKDIDRLVSVPFADPSAELDSTDAKVTRVKALLASESGGIGLHDLLSSEVRRFLAVTTEDAFAPSGQFTATEFVSRLERYEAAAQDVSLLLACVSQWGRPSHLATLQKCIARSSDRLESTGGLTVWLALRWYPLLMELYCCGVAAMDARRFDSLAAVFGTALPSSDYQRTSDTFVEAASMAVLELNRTNVLKQIPGHERNYTPLSDYLLKVLQPRLDDALFLGKNYEAAFDTFEVYFALCAADARLVNGQDAWGPIGRFGWKRGRDNSPFERVLKEANAQKSEWPPLKAGLFGGDLERFKKVAELFTQLISGLHWH